MQGSIPFTRMTLMFAGIFLVSTIIILRLFTLQVLAHAKYQEIAEREQYGYTTLPARRGEILIEDHHSGESYKLATNTTLNMIFADPTLIKNPDLVAEKLAPLLFDLELEKELDEKRYEEDLESLEKIENPILKEEAVQKTALKNDEELLESFTENLEDTLAKRVRDIIIITEDLDIVTQNLIKKSGIEGVEVSASGHLLAYPNEISDKNKAAAALAEIFDTDSKDLESILLGKNRYVILKRKLEPEIADEIEKILENDRKVAPGGDEAPLEFLGIRMRPEYFRFYPEEELAAATLGFVGGNGEGQYGIEGAFNDILKGKDGIFSSQKDANGNQITVGESIIEQAENGADVVLTIDRAIQLQVERFLSKGVYDFRADSGQALIINPKTGAILAMAQSPGFNPNDFGSVFDKEKIEISEEEKENILVSGTEDEPKYWLYIQKNPDVRIELFPDLEAEEETYYAYVNKVGPEVYKNKIIQDVYEPGSVFKSIIMAAGLSAGEVSPNSTFVDSGCAPVDFNVNTQEYDFCIENSNLKHYGLQTMTQVLEKSNNIGMVHVARKLGPNLLYSYLENFGLLERTGVELQDESTGKVEHYRGWTESEMVTKAFGQGISMTPIQLAQAYTALANGGLMMQAQLVKRIEYPDGRIEEFEPKVKGQVISKEASKEITAMMTATGESYLSLRLDNHYLAMKSGTAQTYKNGKALSGAGTTIAGMMSYGPIRDPEFLILVKVDHPRSSEWGEGTAGKITSQIADFLYDYYNIPPDKL